MRTIKRRFHNFISGSIFLFDRKKLLCRGILFFTLLLSGVISKAQWYVYTEQFLGRVLYYVPHGNTMYFCADGSIEYNKAPLDLTVDEIDNVCGQVQTNLVYEYYCQSTSPVQGYKVKFSTYKRPLCLTSSQRIAKVPSRFFWDSGEYAGWIFEWVKTPGCNNDYNNLCFNTKDPVFDGNENISMGLRLGHNEIMVAQLGGDYGVQNCNDNISLVIRIKNLRDPDRGRLAFSGKCYLESQH